MQLLTKLSLALIASALLLNTLVADDEATATDKRKVAALMRLKKIDVNEKPSLKAVVLRVLKTVDDEEQYLEYAERFKIPETSERLWTIVTTSKDANRRVKSLEILLGQSSEDEVVKTISELKDPSMAIDALSLLSNATSLEILKKFLLNKKLSSTAKNSAARGLGKQKSGQQFLLKLVINGELPKECEFTVANALLSPTSTVKEEAAKHLTLPATSGSKPLPPIAELVKRRGQPANGKTVFDKAGTCANCHKVNGGGKEVGPDLSEIGSKLSRVAMYESILNPSAAISHNYENYLAETFDGLSFSGILISDTDEAITLRTAEALTKVIPKEDLDGFKKSKQSLMPNDLQKGFSESDLVDLVEYLMTLKKK